MSKIRLRISHALIVALASAAAQAAYTYFESAGSVFNFKTLVTSVFTGVAAAFFGYLLSKRGDTAPSAPQSP